MSAALYAIRLMWQGHRGDIGCGRVHIDLSRQPEILQALHLSEIEYIPEVHVASVRSATDQWRDMTAEEKAVVRGWIENKCRAVLSAIEGDGLE